MDRQTLYFAIIVTVVFAGTLIGFFIRMSRGFGPHNTSTLVLILVLFVAVLGFVTGKFQDQMTNLLFAVAGYAGGLFSGKDDRKDSKTDAKPKPGDSQTASSGWPTTTR